MFDFIRNNQLNIMLLLCGACAIIALLLFMTRFLSVSRKKSLLLMEFVAFFLLWFDRLAYIYAGDPSHTGYIMVRASNFFVFFLTSGIVFGFNIYLTDWLMHEGRMGKPLLRLKLVQYVSMIGMLLAVISAFTQIYYYFDETNTYHRGQFFLIAYIIPVICPLIQFSVIQQFRKVFGRLIYISMVLYVFVPIAGGIIQIFAYGISIVNMAMVLVSISLYFFTYLDINNTVEHAHEIEIRNMQGENSRMQRLFGQTVTAFVAAVERKDESIKGCSVRVAECAKRIAQLSGKNEEECEKIYYAGLLHNVGLVGIQDDEFFKDGGEPEKTKEIAARMSVIGEEILSNIEELPYLSVGARYCHEKYNGTGYPEGLSGEDIPEIARIIAVADAYVLMKTDTAFSHNMPDFVVREELLKGKGEAFDPRFAELMIKLIDEDGKDNESGTNEVETAVTCEGYREQITIGIPIENEVTTVTFDCKALRNDEDNDFSSPSIILFDSYDRRVHDNERAIEAYKYLEYGEIWFEDHSIQTAARKLQETVKKRENIALSQDGSFTYEIRMGRYDDHLKLVMISPLFEKEVIAALPDDSKSSYIGITGENCEIKNISVNRTGHVVGQDDIPRIVDRTSYIDRMESDIKNIQIDTPRSAATGGIELVDRLKINFHTMSLPGANLIWHCPYIVLFYSEDGKVGGRNYREYDLIKLCGENEGNSTFARNSIYMRKTDDFPVWDAWKKINKNGLECEVAIKRRDNRIVIKTMNLGIEMENTTTVMDGLDKVYVALTGDQVAITDIRIR